MTATRSLRGRRSDGSREKREESGYKVDVAGKWGNRCSMKGMYMRLASAATSEGFSLATGISSKRAEANLY